jgi:ketosteroid isomerase-like protein
MHHTVTPAAVDDLIVSMRHAASAYIAGDMTRYFDLMRHADDFTLMSPFGGDATRESVSSLSAARIAELEDFFEGGECDLEVVETYVSEDLAVLVAVERQHGVVGHLPCQEWSLRVTLVFRYEHPVWRLVHRHADPLVHPITFEQLAELARG